MAKENWSNGDSVSADNMNAINGIDGNTGMTLDGQDIDGHGPKLILPDHVQGVIKTENSSFFTFIENAEMSYDEGITWTTLVNITISRSGFASRLYIDSASVAGTKVTPGYVKIRMPLGVNWDTNLLGTQQMYSSLYPVLSHVTPEPGAFSKYINNSTPIDIFPGDFTTWADADVVELFRGTSMLFTLHPFDATA